MRDRELHSTLRAFAEEAAWTLAAQTSEGAELPFDVFEERGARGGPSLYCYRADTAGFIAERADDLTRLETWLPAVHALARASGLDGYLRARGHTHVPASARERAEAVARVFLERLFEDLSEFVLSDERFVRVHGELEQHLTGGVRAVEVIVPLLGIRISSEEVPLGGGLSLMRPAMVDGVPEAAAWDGEAELVLAMVRGEDERVAAQAPVRVRRLVTALRLYDEPRVAMGPAAWVRTAGGVWQVAPTGAGGLPHGTLDLEAGQEDELRAFCNLVWRRMPRGGALAWALARFEMGCERPAAQRLTDHLLALRALLASDDDRLAERVAALCAPADQRSEVAGQVADAEALERMLIAGHAGAGTDVEAIAAGLAALLRAILRDVLCGHLEPDVRRLADELLAEQVAVHRHEPVDVVDVAVEMGDEDGVLTEL